MSKLGLFARLLPGFLVVTFLAGCGGSTPAAPVIGVAVSPTSVTLIGGASQTFAATLTNDSAGAGVTWTASAGSITSAGVYTAPSPVTTTSATVTATSKTDSSKSASATITLTPISVTVSPTTATLVAGATQTFTATMTADGANAGVTWIASVGSITSAGVYTAPTPVTIATATITATSKTDTTKIATTTVTLTPIAVSMAPTTATLIGGATQTFTPTVTGDTTLNQGVTWTASTGTITSVGVYTAPAVITTTSATVTAASKTDPTKTATATVTLTSTTYTVSGQITSNLLCNTGGLNGVTVSINTSPIQTTTTSSSGNFSFSNIPNGTYTITPSIVGQTSIAYPSTQSVTVNGSNFTAVNFSVTVVNTVSGTVTYTGAQTGQIYLTLNSGCGGGASLGTSISTAGAFTIRGVPTGPYTLQGFMDTLGKGSANASNPSSGTTSLFVVSNSTGASVTLADPATVTLTTAPKLSAVSGFNTGAIAQFKPITAPAVCTNNSCVEAATSYTLQWSTTSSFTTIAGSKTFPANGTHQNVWLVNGLTDGSVYYFRAYGTSAGTAVSPYSSTIGPITIGAPTGGNTVSGAVSFSSAATGPLYVGFVDQNTNTLYGQYIANPVSAQAYSIQVPTGSNYFFVGILDQNNDGIIDVGDISNTGNGSDQTVTVITGPTSNQNLTLPSADAVATVTTQNYQSIFSGGTSQGYNLSFQVNGLIKRPIAVTLASGPNVISPVDIGICGGVGSNCGQGFQIYWNTSSVSPQVNDTYTFNVTYSDATTGTLTAKVTAVLSGFATNLAPQTGTGVSTTPTFTWTDPTNASSYTYQFYMNDSNGNTIWQIPGSNSKSNGFTSSTTSITWGTDPTGGGSTPSVGSLTLGTNYNWQIQVQDSNGNSAVTQVQYQP